MKPRSVIGYTLGFLGVLIVVITLGFHFWLHYARPDGGHEFLYFPTVAGAVVGWWGFYWADSRRAQEGGGFLLDAAERIKAVRLGRRKSDAVVVTEPIPLPVVEDRHPVTPDTPVAIPAAVVQPPTEASD
jgi:hypothetical protein